MEPADYLRKVARVYGLSSYFGLLTSVPMDKLSVKSFGEVTVFATAGVMNPNERVGTINIIAVFECRMSRAAMLNAIITATEAKNKSYSRSWPQIHRHQHRCCYCSMHPEGQISQVFRACKRCWKKAVEMC